MNKQSGFTLIEIMIAVVIVAILASVAVATYSSQVQKSRRTCGTGALVAMAAQQERWFFQFNRYQDDVVALYGATECPEGFYQLEIDASQNSSGACATVNGCYTLTATAINAQVADEQCRTFTLDNLGVRGSLDDRDQITQQCW